MLKRSSHQKNVYHSSWVKLSITINMFKEYLLLFDSIKNVCHCLMVLRTTFMDILLTPPLLSWLWVQYGTTYHLTSIMKYYPKQAISASKAKTQLASLFRYLFLTRLIWWIDTLSHHSNKIKRFLLTKQLHNSQITLEIDTSYAT